MIRSDLHIHTTFSDGKHTVEENVLSAIEKGCDKIGFSDHSYTSFDESYCMKKEEVPLYIQTIKKNALLYKDKIEVLCGVEQDLFSTEKTDEFDYVIGAVHYLKIGETYVPVDESPDILEETAKKYFGGDMYALCERYFKQTELLADKPIDIIAHFDLIAKFNEKCKLFDEHNERYVAAYCRAADILLQKKVPFEINTGAMARGWRTEPYPIGNVRTYLREKGATFILSSDSHDKNNILYAFDQVNL